MMPVVPAPLSEGLLVRDIRIGIEHVGISPIVRDPVSFQIGNVPGEWSGAEAATVVTYHVCLRQHPTRT